MGETRRDTLEHEDIVDGDDVDVVDPLFFELLVGVYVARDLRAAGARKCAGHANLQRVSLIPLPGSSTAIESHTMTFLPLTSAIWKVCSGSSSLTAALVGNSLPGWISLLALAATWCEIEERMEAMVRVG